MKHCILDVGKPAICQAFFFPFLVFFFASWFRRLHGTSASGPVRSEPPVDDTSLFLVSLSFFFSSYSYSFFSFFAFFSLDPSIKPSLYINYSCIFLFLLFLISFKWFLFSDRLSGLISCDRIFHSDGNKTILFFK